MDSLNFLWVPLLSLMVYLLLAALRNSSRQTDLTGIDEQRHTEDSEPVLAPLFESSAPQAASSEFSMLSNNIDRSRNLPQANPRLADLLTRSLGEDWITQPTQLAKLKELANNTEFCRDWWQIKRDNKQELATAISALRNSEGTEQLTSIAVNLNSLFDVQLAAIEPNQRQVLNLLHIITLYIRLKINANEDTIQRFTHRAVPRTFIFVGETSFEIAGSISNLIQQVARVVNRDREVQGRLQVVCLDRDRGLPFYASADLSEQLSRVSAEDFAMSSLNSAATIGTRTKTNLELQQRIGSSNIFLFGSTPQAAEQLSTNYDPQQIYAANAELRQAIDLIASGYFSEKDGSTFKPLIDQLLSEDPEFVLADYLSYIVCQEEISQIYQDQKAWTRRSILTAAAMALLESDRATLQPHNV